MTKGHSRSKLLEGANRIPEGDGQIKCMRGKVNTSPLPF